jgi:HAMP domain-containing protein
MNVADAGTARARGLDPPRAALPAWRRLGWRVGAGSLLLIALGVALSGYLQYRAQDRFLRRSLGELLLNIARTGAFVVDGDLHQEAIRAGSMRASAYGAVREALRRIQETNELRDPVSTLFDVEDDRAKVGVVGSDAVPVGSEYRIPREARQPLRRAFREGAASFTGLYVNERGAWITAFAPIRNSAGQTVAVLDVDFRAGVYLARLAALRRQAWLHAMVAALLGLLAGALLARRITRPLAELTNQARRVVAGDFTGRAPVEGRDELAQLGQVLHVMVERLRVSHANLVGVLARALEAHRGQEGALARLAAASLAVGDRVGLTPVQREALELGARLHDIGELGIPDALLAQGGPLTMADRRAIERHPTAGVDVLEPVPLLTPALDVVGAHHERWDGGGYPQGLRGEEIPLVARVFAVVDALDAMTHERPYRAAVPVEDALERVRAEAGKQFDPRVVEAALTLPGEEWSRLLGRPGSG